MADEIKVEHELWNLGIEWSHYVQITMTNSRGTTYLTHIYKKSEYRLLGPSRVTNEATKVSIRTRNAPKWVQRTINEQIPIVAIMFS